MMCSFQIRFLFLSFILINPVFGQDFSYSQFYNNPMYLNPAYTGLDRGMKIAFNQRKQWTHIQPSFLNTSVSVGAQVLNLGGGIGLTYSRDEEGAGNLISNQWGFLYSYKVILFPKMLEMQMGSQVDLVTKKIEWSKLEFSDQFNPVDGKIYSSAAIPPISHKKRYADFNSGIIIRGILPIFSKDIKYTLGSAIHHMTEPDESLLNQEKILPRKKTIHVLLLIPFKNFYTKSNTFVSPMFFYSKQNNFSTTNIGVQIQKNKLFFGCWYRNQTPEFSLKNSDALIFSGGAEFSTNNHYKLQVFLSFDHTISALKLYTGSTPEISLIYQQDIRMLEKFKSKISKRKNQKCFDWNSPINPKLRDFSNSPE